MTLHPFLTCSRLVFTVDLQLCCAICYFFFYKYFCVPAPGCCLFMTRFVDWRPLPPHLRHLAAAGTVCTQHTCNSLISSDETNKMKKNKGIKMYFLQEKKERKKPSVVQQSFSHEATLAVPALITALGPKNRCL